MAPLDPVAPKTMPTVPMPVAANAGAEIMVSPAPITPPVKASAPTPNCPIRLQIDRPPLFETAALFGASFSVLLANAPLLIAAVNVNYYFSLLQQNL